MATEKKITSRIQQKHDVAANWAKATNFIPKKGEIIIYDAEYNASGEETQAVRFKIGDGSKTVNNLPFAVIDRTVKLGGGSAPSGATTPSSETVVNKLYVNKFLNSKSFRAICEWLDSDQILVMITTEYSVIYLHHSVGMFKSEITTSSSDITPVDTSNLGTYHFIIATEVYNTGTEVTRKVLYSERSGDAHFSYRDPVTGSTVTWEDTVDAGWSGMVNENYEYDAGGDYRIIIQPVYCGLDQGKTPVGNYFFAGSPFTVEYASSILSSVVTESVLGGDRDRGYYCNKTWRTNRLSGWRCYQTGNLIGDFPFNTDLNATACGTCFYNIIGEASNASEGSLQGTSLKRVILEANGAIITKVVPIVSNRADGNGDWTLCACSLYAGSTYAKYGLWVIPNPLTIEGPLGDSSETVFWDNSWTFDTTKGFVPELNGPVDGKQVKYINFEALSLLNKYFIFTQQYETIRLSINEIADIQGKYALAMASSVGEISTSLINVEQSVSGKQDKITSTNKLSSELVSGLGAAAAKAVDTAISANSTSTNLPTSKAVEDRINAHSGIDKVGTITGIKMNGASKGTSGVVDLGTVLTKHQSIKSINTNNTAAQTVNASEAIAGSGTINLHKIAKTGNYNDLLNKPTIPSVSGKLNKTTYEYNEELALGSNGKVLIGIFPMYDTNLTVHISSTTSTTYSGTLVIATQNFGGPNRIIRCNLYGDATGTLHSCLVVQQSSDVTDSRIFIYGNFAGWSKNLVHIQAVGLAGPPEELMVSATTIPTTDLVTIHNVLDENFAKLTGNNKFTGDMSGVGHPYRVFPNEDAYAAYLSGDPTNVAYTSQTNAAFIINTDSKNRTLISNGLIRYKKESTQYYDLTLPTKTGTLATTSDIPIKSATLSGTVLTITLP